MTSVVSSLVNFSATLFNSCLGAFSCCTCRSKTYKVIREWQLEDGKVVRFIRQGDKFISDLIVGEKTYREFLQIPKKISPKIIEAEILKRQAYLSPLGKIDYITKATAKSQLDSTKTIDEGHWGITIVDLGKQKLKKSNTWGGHSVIVIELIEKGEYKMMIAHILPSEKDTKIADVIFGDITFSDLQQNEDGTLRKKLSKTPTWIRTRYLVLDMLDQINKEKIAFQQGNPIIFFDYYGGAPTKSSYNCITWVRKTVLKANITLPKSIIDIFVSLPSVTIGLCKEELIKKRYPKLSFDKR